MNVEKLRYTKKEACYALAISLRSLDYMIASKKIDTRRAGGRVLIPTSEVRRIASMNDYEGSLKQRAS